MSDKNVKKDKFIIFILIVLMIFIFFLTIYFILDVFGIIKVPNKFSIASLFYSQIEIIATGGKILTNDEIIEEDKTQVDIINNDSNTTNLEDNKETENNNSSIDIQNKIDELEKIQNEKNQTPEVNISQEIEVNNFYYEQLDEYGKIIYDKLYSNIEKLKTGTYTADFGTTFDSLLHQEDGEDILNNSFQLAINALTFDNPELFFIDITKINLITEINTRAFSTTYRISIGKKGSNYLAEEFKNLTEVNSAILNVENIKNEILSKTGEDKIENLKIVHDYLVDNVVYDVNVGKTAYNIYGPFINKRAVCEGYAKAYKLILDELNIPCIIACGRAKNSSGKTESHAWNYVQIDGNWYAIDVTWDDPVIIGNGTVTNDIKYKYFLVGADEFFKDHFEDGNIAVKFKFKYPELMKTNY